MAERRGKAAPRRRAASAERREVRTGVAHMQATFNNTIVTLTDKTGNVVSWSSAGSAGFKGSRKSTPFAAQTAAELAAPQGHGVRAQADRGLRPRTGGRPRGRPSARCRRWVSRSPRSATSRRSRTTAAGRRSGGGCRGRRWPIRDAKCRLVPPRGHEAVLKGARCFTDKCAIERRNYPPGSTACNRGKLTPTACSCARSRRPSGSTACWKPVPQVLPVGGEREGR
jgi:hypothetical protein